jgi:hypothetical protein
MISRWILKIRNISDKSCRQSQNKHCSLDNCLPFKRKCGKKCWSQTGDRWQHAPNVAQKKFSCHEGKSRKDHRLRLTMFNTYCFVIDLFRLVLLNVKLATDLSVLTICLAHCFPECTQRIARDSEQLSGDPWIHFCDDYIQVYLFFN